MHRRMDLHSILELGSTEGRHGTHVMGHLVKITTGEPSGGCGEKSVILEEPKLGFLLIWVYMIAYELPHHNTLGECWGCWTTVGVGLPCGRISDAMLYMHFVFTDLLRDHFPIYENTCLLTYRSYVATNCLQQPQCSHTDCESHDERAGFAWKL